MTLTFTRRGLVALAAGVVTGVLAVRWLEREFEKEFEQR